MQNLVEPCLYNWLGYGNPNGKYWFIGTEEGGAEIWRNQTLSLEESLRKRAKFQLAMDFKTVWETLYQLPLSSFKGATVWRYIAAYLLAFEGIEPEQAKAQLSDTMQNQLGKRTGEHFLCELYPLPKRSKGQISPYESIWPDVKAYHQQVQPQRFELITQTLQANPQVQLIIAYEKSLTELLLQHFQAQIMSQQNWLLEGRQKFQLSDIQLTPQRKLQLLSTPFFGQGQISYAAIWQSVKHLQARP